MLQPLDAAASILDGSLLGAQDQTYVARAMVITATVCFAGLAVVRQLNLGASDAHFCCHLARPLATQHEQDIHALQHAWSTIAMTMCTNCSSLLTCCLHGRSVRCLVRDQVPQRGACDGGLAAHLVPGLAVCCAAQGRPCYRVEHRVAGRTVMRLGLRFINSAAVLPQHQQRGSRKAYPAGRVAFGSLIRKAFDTTSRHLPAVQDRHELLP